MIPIVRRAAVAVGLLCALGLIVVEAAQATTFTRSTVLSVDQASKTVTFRTQTGQTWTLPVAHPDLLKDKPLATGDQVSIDLDLDDRITEIAKLSEPPTVKDAAPQGE
jgi:hypothetical protein